MSEYILSPAEFAGLLEQKKLTEDIQLVVVEIDGAFLFRMAKDEYNENRPLNNQRLKGFFKVYTNRKPRDDEWVTLGDHTYLKLPDMREEKRT